VGNGDTLDTAAIQKAIDTCADSKDGGVVLFNEDGQYLTAQVVVKDNVRLRIPKTATILAGTKVSVR
jgi:polygalacturonase